MWSDRIAIVVMEGNIEEGHGFVTERRNPSISNDPMFVSDIHKLYLPIPTLRREDIIGQY